TFGGHPLLRRRGADARGAPGDLGAWLSLPRRSTRGRRPSRPHAHRCGRSVAAHSPLHADSGEPVPSRHVVVRHPRPAPGRIVMLHYLVDNFTDPWTEPETILLLHGTCERSL